MTFWFRPLGWAEMIVFPAGGLIICLSKRKSLEAMSLMHQKLKLSLNECSQAGYKYAQYYIWLLPCFHEKFFPLNFLMFEQYAYYSYYCC